MNNKGFTLTELMVVIVIIGILSMLAIPKFMGTTTKAKLAEFPAILMQIYSLQDGFYQETNKYASTLKELDFTDPDSKYLEYSLTGDGKTFIAKATVKIDLKDGSGNNLKDEFVSINEKKEHGGTENIRRVARW